VSREKEAYSQISFLNSTFPAEGFQQKFRKCFRPSPRLGKVPAHTSGLKEAVNVSAKEFGSRPVPMFDWLGPSAFLHKAKNTLAHLHLGLCDESGVGF
jgi:hypothetical protein